MAPELLNVIVISVSCVAFCLVVLMLVVALYRKDPLFCWFRPHRAEHHTDDSLHYHSRHTLIGLNEHSAAMNQGAVGPQLPGTLYIIGMPNDSHLNGALPRLPSYESVCKEDQQRHISSMISQRFGLSASHDEAPPSYEDTLRQTCDISPIQLHSLDVNLPAQTQDDSSQPWEEEDTANRPSTGRQRPPSPCRPALSSRFLSIR